MEVQLEKEIFLRLAQIKVVSLFCYKGLPNYSGLFIGQYRFDR